MGKLLRQNSADNVNSFYSICKNKIVICLFFVFLIGQNVQSQNLVFANTISSDSYVTDSNLAIDADLTTRARVRANSGIALGIGAYNGHIELEFPTILPANTTTYVKIETEDNLLDVLLGGQLGGILSDVLGVVLFGNQEFTVQAKNNSTVVLEGNSQVNYDFAGPRLKVITDGLNNKYLMITPSQAYNRIRITDRIGSLIGLGNTKDLWVYGAFYYNPPSDCGLATYTSYSGSGLSLDLLTLGGAGVQNPNHVIDNDLNTYSRLSLGVIAVAGSIEQTVYFQGLSNSTDSFIVRLKVDPALLALGLANNIEIIAYNGPNIVQTVDLLSLLNLDLLAILQGSQIASIPFTPNQPVDRVTVRYTALLNVQLTQSLDLYDIVRVPKSPTIDVASQNTTICSGNTASLIAYSDPTTLEINWYDADANGNLLGTTLSGEAFTTSVINTTTTFYVASSRANCPEESLRVPVIVNVNQSPIATDINVAGNVSDICAIQPIVLTPSSTVSSVFNWYLANDYTQEITNGMIAGGVNYAIDANGVLTVTGLNNINSPYTFYVSVTNETTSCKNVAGDLKEVQVTIIDADAPTTTSSTQNFCVSEGATLAQLQVNESNIVWYDAPTGGNALAGTTLLVDDQIYYASQVGANGCESSIRLMITVNLDDTVAPTTADTTQEFCVIESATVSQLQTNESNVVWYDVPNGGVALAGTTPLVDNGIYYASQVGTNGCESSVRLMVTVDLDDTLPPTTTDTTQEFCVSQGATVAQLQVNESNIVWYDAATAGNVLPNTTLLVDNGVYYAVQVVTNGCESSTRLMITVDVNDTVAPTTTDTTQEFCVSQGATVAQLQVNESNIVWYDAATAGNALPSTTLLVDNGVYYASQVGTNGCESSIRLMVTVDVNDTPTPTTTANTQEFCISQGATVAQLQVNESNIVWYNLPTGGTALAGSTLLVDNGVYYAAQVGTNGCESSTRLMITVDILSNSIATITPTNSQVCLGTTNTFTTTSGMSNYQWTITG
ncbi:MAG: gliding motility-associated C-terminal domain-containing protein, partial [Bacteroidia bacterium]